VIVSRRRIDNDGPKSAGQSANFPVNRWAGTNSAARTAYAFVMWLAARPLNLATGARTTSSRSAMEQSCAPVRRHRNIFGRSFCAAVLTMIHSWSKSKGNKLVAGRRLLCRVDREPHIQIWRGNSRTSSRVLRQPKFPRDISLNAPDPSDVGRLGGRTSHNCRRSASWEVCTIRHIVFCMYQILTGDAAVRPGNDQPRRQGLRSRHPWRRKEPRSARG
jgi:hypothetical protein